MRFKTYQVRSQNTKEVATISFDESMYAEVGIGYCPGVGMTQLEAYQLVNQWNKQQSQYVYTLEEN